MASPNNPSKHARVYQACEPCRIKKVRCNLGSVDNPADPPCARCRRESKECYFTVTRKRVLTGTDAKSFVLRNKRRKVPPTVTEPGLSESVGAVIDVNPVDSSDSQGKQEGFREALLQNAAYTDEDALDMLYRAGSNTNTLGETARSRLPGDGKSYPVAQPALTNVTEPSNGRKDALDAWSDVRFVHEGLFSGEEAILYIEFFHGHLKPFTPILSVDFKRPETHRLLIEENPILAVTMLMLASRYCTLPGAGGVSRRYIIHDRLWEFLRSMIMRIFWAQDPCPRSTSPRKSSSSGLRTLGTCEALLILTEWHPRSLHFPAGGDDAHILTSKRTFHKNSFTDQDPLFWLEWSWRSDRLCWSLLGTALTLAIELGLLDDCDNTTLGARETTSRSWRDPAFGNRAFRLGQYLWVYSTQISGRLGWKYLAPYKLPERPGAINDDTSKLWTGIATLMRRGNELLFSSRQHTKEIIRNGRYIGLLYTFQTSLQEWRSEFGKANLSPQMRVILTIDLGYIRVYFNSIAAQAIMENKRNGKLPLHRSNEDFAMEIVDGARSILECVLNDLEPDGSLAYIPIRAYFRILTATLFLLKTTYLNVTSFANIESSLALMERVGKAFQTCSPDDAHLSSRWGMLLSNLSSRQLSFMRRRNNSEGHHHQHNHHMSSQLRGDQVSEQQLSEPETDLTSAEGGGDQQSDYLSRFLDESSIDNTLENFGWYEMPSDIMDNDTLADAGLGSVQMPWAEQLGLTIPFSGLY